MSNPCLRCGACCAHFRVAFHWSETEPFLGGTVPASLTERLDPHRLAMRGTAGGLQPRCQALQGQIGEQVSCSIYAQRPSPCRALQPDGLHQVASPQCRQARARHGLPALDWPGSEDPLVPRSA